jgi:hypothetical protein
MNARVEGVPRCDHPVLLMYVLAATSRLVNTYCADVYVHYDLLYYHHSRLSTRLRREL